MDSCNTIYVTGIEKNQGILLFLNTIKNCVNMFQILSSPVRNPCWALLHSSTGLLLNPTRLPLCHEFSNRAPYENHSYYRYKNIHIYSESLV